MLLFAQNDLSRIVANPNLLLLIGVGTFAALALLVRVFRRKLPAESPKERAHRDQSGGVFGSLTEALAGQIPESEQESREFNAILKQAGFYGRFARASVYAFRFILFAVPLTAAGVMLIFAPKEHYWPIMIGGGLLAMGLSIIPRFYVFMRRQARLQEIRNGLADMMDMLGMCLGGGMALSPSLDHVAKHLTNYPSLAFELQLIKRQAEVGSLRLALADFAGRVDIPEARQVSSLLARGERLGTGLSTTLLDQADHFRSTRRNLATTAANRTPIFLSLPLMFCFAPSVLVLLMSPTLLQLNEFFNPKEGQGALSGNEAMSMQNITRTMSGLDQSLPADSAPARPNTRSN
jgi:tight adherence protein C